jgi:hypothetical protein
MFRNRKEQTPATSTPAETAAWPPAWDQAPAAWPAPAPPGWGQQPPAPQAWSDQPLAPPGWGQQPPAPPGWGQQPPAAPAWDQQSPAAPAWDQQPPAAPAWGQPGPDGAWGAPAPEAVPGQVEEAAPQSEVEARSSYLDAVLAPTRGPAPWDYPGTASGWPVPQAKGRSWLNWIIAGIGILALAAAAVLLAGSFRHKYSQGTATAGGAAPAGYTTFSDTADGFSIALPSQWRDINPTSAGTSQALAQFANDNPAFKAILNSGVRSDLRLFAGSADGRSGLDILSHPAPGVRDADVTSQLSQAESAYQALGIKVTGTGKETVAGHQAGVIQGTFTFNGPLGSQSASETQYIVDANDNLYVITILGTSSDFPTILGTFTLN